MEKPVVPKKLLLKILLKDQIQKFIKEYFNLK